MESTSINWKQIIIVTIITGAVTIITGMALYYLQAKEPQLTYFLTNTTPFIGDNVNLAIYQIVISNDGKKMVEDVSFQVTFEEGIIKDYKIGENSVINYKTEKANGVFKTHFNNLNPTEKVSISILVSNKGKFAPRPEVSLRGKGILGRELKADEKKPLFYNVLFASIISGYSVIAIFIFLSKIKGLYPTLLLRHILLFSSGKGVHSDKQNEILAFLFSLRGRITTAEDYLNRQKSFSYWSESDRISAMAIESNDPEETEELKQILIDLLEYAKISPTSIALIHYNIARIAKYQSKEEDYNRHIEKSKHLIPAIIKKRMEIDPIFKKNIDS